MIIDVYFLVMPNTVALDIIGPAETLMLAKDNYRINYIGINSKEVCTTGMVISDIKPLPETLPENSILFVPGVNNSLIDFETQEAKQITTWIKGFQSQVNDGILSIACVCSGVILAARAGLLDNKKCTTHHTILSLLKQSAPKTEVIDNLLFVECEGIYTCAGIVAGIDLALNIISKQCGVRLSINVAREMVVYIPRQGGDSQESPWLKHRHHHHPILHRAQDAVVSQPEKKWTVESLAVESHVSPRHLSRLFKQYLNISVKGYQEHIKVTLANKYLKQGLSLEQSALNAGFSSSRQLVSAQKRIQSSSVQLK